MPIAGREPVTIHPQDAQARGLSMAIWCGCGTPPVRCWPAPCDGGIRPGVICLHEGRGPTWIRRSASAKNRAVNVLTKDIPTSRLGNGCAGNTALAWLEKYTGLALPLTAFDPPANAYHVGC